jgi:hypothetical protein
VSKKADPVEFLDNSKVDMRKSAPITLETNPDMRIKWSRTYDREDVHFKEVPNTPEFDLGLPCLRPNMGYSGVGKQPNDTAYCMLNHSGEVIGKECNAPGYNRYHITHSIWLGKWDAFTGQGGDSGGG